MLRRKKFYVIYPEYFDAKLSRSEGRRVPLELADESSHVQKLVKACEKLGINHQLQKEKSFPKKAWENSGRILIPINPNEKIPKCVLLKEIGPVARRFVAKKKMTKKISKKRKPASTQKEKKSITRTASARRNKRI